VKFTALDAAALGLKTHFIEDASRGVDLHPWDIERAIEEVGMKSGSAFSNSLDGALRSSISLSIGMNCD
jgi:nicotinamidase-related amidase